ncbi:MAG: UDP-N-acetylglucosamine 2-epimerase (hydrolyzing) [Bacteroidales bacterium]|nr:UDP-N-acetylglucosamine 2-epimerase (hydrolyzing) [Bacteroidales bacterium]
MKKICFFTGSRAEYGILSSLMKAISSHPEMTLQIVATNMHLSPEYGLTVNEIERDGFRVDRRVEMLLSSDTSVGTAKSVGLGIIGYADALDQLAPDLVVILGDRYEMLGVAQTALLFNIPVAHLHGGEITEGAYDDAIRHAITKLSHLHFTSTEEYRQNVIQLGEDPARVFSVGALGVDNIMEAEIMPRADIERYIDFDLSGDYAVVTFHPVTAEPGEAEVQTAEFLNGLEQMLGQLKFLITLPNSDTEARAVSRMMQDFEAAHPDRVKCVRSLGRNRYYSAVSHSVCVAGNSSSGLIEAPSLGVPTVNVGNRQKGRARGESVIDVECKADAVAEGLRRALADEMQTLAATRPNPYFRADTLESIMKVLSETDIAGLNPKKFHIIPGFRGE